MDETERSALVAPSSARPSSRPQWSGRRDSNPRPSPWQGHGTGPRARLHPVERLVLRRLFRSVRRVRSSPVADVERVKPLPTESVGDFDGGGLDVWAATRPTLAAGFLVLLADRSHIPLGPGLPRPGTVARPAAGTGYWRPWPASWGVGRGLHRGRRSAEPFGWRSRRQTSAMSTMFLWTCGALRSYMRAPRGMRRERLRTHPDRPCSGMRAQFPFSGFSIHPPGS